MEFQQRLSSLRKQKGISQEALAEKLGVSRQAVSKWENGEAMPETTKLPALAKVFGVSIDWLLSEEEPMATDGENASDREETGSPPEEAADIKQETNTEWMDRLENGQT